VLGCTWDAVFLASQDEFSFSQWLPPFGQQIPVVLKAAGDRLVNLMLTCYELPPEEGAQDEIALVFREISAESALQRQLVSYTANLAHEFRTPLSALAASIELLQDQATDLTAAQVADLLGALRLSVLNLQNLVDNLLEGASIEAGGFHISPRTSSLESIVTEAAEIMKPLLDKFAQRLSVEIPAGLPLVYADHRRVVQVLVNLLSNASKYGPQGVEISISARRVDGQVEVNVADRGPGIASQFHEVLFQTRDGSLPPGEAAKAGAGLGLLVVKTIVEAHGGRIGVKDRSGGGSVFWFTLLTAPEP
jgi:signal transduction histidine kinase